jgi:ribonuclease HII
VTAGESGQTPVERSEGASIPSQEEGGPALPDRPLSQPRRRRPRRKRWSAIEKELRGRIGPILAGIDEVGIGPIAGPVVACAVIMPPNMRAIAGVDDSKKLTARQRERLATKIRKKALAVAVGAASVREIDRINIYRASILAMKRALAKLPIVPDHVVVDGRAIRTLGVEHTAVVKGDARCFSIACASIIAKVTRDRLMASLGRRYPEYNWQSNVGYTTASHVHGLDARGISPHHRRSFVRVSQLELALGGEGATRVEILNPAGLLENKE